MFTIVYSLFNILYSVGSQGILPHQASKGMKSIPSPPKFGKNLQELRKEKGLSLDDLAKVSGVSKAMLSQIELHKVNPTVGLVWKIAHALDVSLNDLLMPKTQDDGLFELTPDTSSPRLTDQQASYTIQIISSLEMMEDLELYIIHLEPHATLESTPHMPRTEEIATALSGKIEIQAGEHKQTLRPFDSLRYNVDQTHSIRNLGSKPARVYLVVHYRKTTPYQE